MFLLGLLCWNAVLEIQGCGGKRKGGYGDKGGKGEVNKDPPAVPGPCKCIGSDAFKDSKKKFKKFPEDTGKWCNKWDFEYSRSCKDDENDDKDWKMEWCDKKYCLVADDCELDDVETQYAGNFAEDHKMNGKWSSKNCDESLYPKTEENKTSP
jgi:hypothetical protein